MSDAMLPVIVNRAKINDNAIAVNTTDISDRDNKDDFNLAMLSRGGGGGYFGNFWVGVCHWDPGTLSLYQS